MRACSRRSATSCAWSRACRAARRRSSLAKGSCRDTGWLLVTILRHLGFAARFASGYLIQLMPDEKPLEGPGGPDARLHRPPCLVRGLPAGRRLDRPRSDLGPADRRRPHPARLHARAVERGADRGRGRGERGRLLPRHEGDARARDAAHHQALHRRAVGEAAGASARRSSATSASSDVRLTMGGEPTFVSIDDMDGDEWNTLALGPEKRRMAGVLFRKLADRFASGPLLHFGQGKWYPGEQLPRWALNCHWRKDGEAIWRDPHLYALEDKPTGATPETAHRFALAFAQRLQLDPGYLFGAFEDTWYYLWRERRLPSNVTVDAAKVEGRDGARAAGARVRAGPRQLRSASCCPIQREHNGRRPLAQRAVVPALGEVLPDPGRFAARLPPAARFAAVGGAGRTWTSPSIPIRWRRIPTCRRSTPSAARRCCAARSAGRRRRHQRRRRRAPRGLAARAGARSRRLQARRRPLGRPHRAHRDLPSSRATAISTSSCRRPNAPRTISTSSPRSRTPPRSSASRCSSKAIRRRAAIRACTSFSVTPDPGVIEVNIHPSASWRELVDQDRDRLRGSAARRGSARRNS